MSAPARRAAAALALLAAAAPAAGYVRSTTDDGIPLAWPVPLISYNENLPYDPARPSLAPSCAPGPSGDPARAAVRAAFDAWHVSCSELELVDAGPIAEIRTGLLATSENLVVVRQGWCSDHPQARSDECYDDPDVNCGGSYNCFEDHSDADKTILALTSTLYYVDSGRIVDADIEVNGWDGQGGGGPLLVGTHPDLYPPHGWYFTCSEPEGQPQCATYGQTGCYYADLRNTLTHEVGHFIGLRHVCWGGGSQDMDLPACTGDPGYAEITMYPSSSPGNVAMRDLHADDVAGVCAVYPASSGGGCGCGAGGGPGALAALLALAALRPRRRRRARA